MARDCIAQETLDAVVDLAVAAAVDGASVALVTNTGFNPQPTLTFSDLEEVSASWYTRKATTIYDLSRSEDGGAQIAVQSVVWNHDGIDEPVTITGYALVGVSNTLVSMKALPESKLMSSDVDQLIVEPCVGIPPVSQES